MCNLIQYKHRRSFQYHTVCVCECACVCVFVRHTDRPAQQSNQFVTDVKILVKKKIIMIMVVILLSRSDGDKA